MVSVGYGATLDGYVGDSAVTLVVGSVAKEVEDLVERTRTSLYEAIAVAIPNPVGDIGSAVESTSTLATASSKTSAGTVSGDVCTRRPDPSRNPGPGRRLKSGWCGH